MTAAMVITKDDCHAYLRHLMAKHPLPSGCRVDLRFVVGPVTVGSIKTTAKCTASVASKKAVIEIGEVGSWEAYHRLLSIGHEYKHAIQFLKDGATYGTNGRNWRLEYEADMFGAAELKSYLDTTT
jgi:hypothetical protein